MKCDWRNSEKKQKKRKTKAEITEKKTKYESTKGKQTL